jgi:hypothetical protein
MLDPDVNGRVGTITRQKPGASANVPMKQYGMYVQDDWHVRDRLTINAGLRYDLVTGFDIDQSKIPNYITLTNAADAGRFDGVPGWDEFKKDEGEDLNNIQPRIGAVYDLRGDGRDVVRGGWGIYYDFGYTNANILFPALSAQGGSGVVFTVNNTSGIRNPDGSFFRVGQPISNVASQNEVNPNGPFFSTQLSGPQVRQPWTSQVSVGWSHQIDPFTVLDVDYVHTDGKDLGVRWGLNTRIGGVTGTRRYADLGLNPAAPTLNLSIGESTYDGINFGVRRRMSKGVQFNAWYSIQNAKGRGGQAVDELTSGLVQDATQPFADVQNGPAGRTDVRHRVSLSAIFQMPWGFQVAPTARFQSARPVHIWYGYDNNADLANNDVYTTAYRYTGIDDNGVPSYKEMGACTTVNCGRGASFAQVNFRVSKMVRIHGSAGIDFFGEVFNVFNSINPAFNVGAVSSGAFYTGTVASHTANPVFLKPNSFAGDAGNGEQRVGQIGFRFAF